MSEPFECVEILEKAKERYKFDHQLQYVAITNALGKAFTKNYNYNDVFENKANKEVEDIEKERLKDYFENW